MAKLHVRRLRIPEQHRAPLRELVELEEAAYQELSEALQKATPSISTDELAIAVAPKSLSEDQVQRILAVVMSLSLTREYHSLDTETVVADVASRASDDLGITNPAAVDTLRRRLTSFLDMERPLGVSARALGVLVDHERLFEGSRILTDLRPIFLSGNSDEPVAAVLVHHLKIESHTGDSHREHFFALDARDLRELRKMIDRAIRKEEALISLISGTQITYLPVETED